MDGTNMENNGEKPDVKIWLTPEQWLTGKDPQLEKAIARELKPLKLGRSVIRVAITPLAEGEGGPNGIDWVEFDAETNPGAGFGPLRKIASGGELARVSLALKCALAEAGSALTLIFDEADQGVGGAVAAALRLSEEVENAVIVAIICDRGDRYLSTGVYDEPN